MKYSNYIGVISAVSLIAFCFVPWVFIESINTTITGLSAEHTNFGRPGLLHIILVVLSIILFLISTVWAKRLNVFVASLNFAWAIRNYLLITRCELGECPEKRIGMYAILVFSLLVFLMSLLPKIKLKDTY